ncbi:MAG: DUF6384 family protein [Parvularculaceae bacterium]
MTEIVASGQSLDDVMLAMDVVDTLRHRSRLVEKELNADGRREDLISRLKEIYASQGITVTDKVLAEGVAALEESRFTYVPPKNSFSTRLAKLYVARGRWLRTLGFVGVLAAFIWSAYFFGVQRPQTQQAEQAEHYLTHILPGDLTAGRDLAAQMAQNPVVVARVESLYKQGQAQLAAQDADSASKTLAEIDRITTTLQQVYTIRVVNRAGENSGVWRIPDVNQGTRNFYLIVEAIDEQGATIETDIMSEESGTVKHVRKWGIRVDEVTMGRIRSDKSDDGIIQEDVVGQKQRGVLEPSYSVITDGGMIWEW